MHAVREFDEFRLTRGLKTVDASDIIAHLDNRTDLILLDLATEVGDPVAENAGDFVSVDHVVPLGCDEGDTLDSFIR